MWREKRDEGKPQIDKFEMMESTNAPFFACLWHYYTQDQGVVFFEYSCRSTHWRLLPLFTAWPLSTGKKEECLLSFVEPFYLREDKTGLHTKGWKLQECHFVRMDLNVFV